MKETGIRIANVNSKRLKNWSFKQKLSNTGYKGYTWMLLSKSKVIDNHGFQYWLYQFMFYDKYGEQYAIKSVSTDFNYQSSLYELGTYIIDNDGGFYVDTD